MRTIAAILVVVVCGVARGQGVDPGARERAQKAGKTFATDAELIQWADRTNAADKAKAASAPRREALRQLKATWTAMGYSWPPAEGQLVTAIASQLAEIEKAANAGDAKKAILTLARCTAALALYNYVGAELALTADVPEN